MFLWIAEQLGFPGVLNLFRYISFRAGGATATSLIIGLLIGPKFIGWLRVRQGKGQPIREDGPQTHLAKRGTPTMGGLMILTSLTVSMLMWMDFANRYLWACLFITVGFGLIGFLDDYDKVKKRSHKGVSGRVRLLAEFLVAGIGCLIIAWGAGTELYIPFYNGPVVDLWLFYIPFGAFVVVAFGNAVNLTDGLDGLATMPVIIASLAFLLISYLVGNAVYAPYLGVPYVPGAGNLTVLCSAIVGAGLAFLWFNAPPAAVFMGDTGSLALGGALGAIAVATQHQVVLGIIGGLFVVEALSVIIQVVVYKRTGKRVFRMAPIHHHFEQLGWSEPTVVIRFWIISFVLALAGLSTLKLAVITSPVFAGKRYAVLGLARSGQASVEALVASGAEVMAWDNREEARAAVAGKAEIADLLHSVLRGFDGVVVSPGVPLNRHPIAEHAAAAGVPVIGDIELFALARPTLPPHRVVGITGTNGKSTTTAIVCHIARTAGLPATMAGNIGYPILGQDPLPAGGVYVLELSSYQIDLTHSLDCDAAVLLNISPDHLDRYGALEVYAASKARLFDMLSPGHAAVIAVDDELSRRIAGRVTAHKFLVSSSDIADQTRWPALQGPHSAQNVAAAAAVARALDIDDDTIEHALQTYRALPHRMELVAERGGVRFVNDSKATNPDSAAPALASFPAVHWILGGLPKGDDLGPCEAHLDHVRAAYTIGEAGPMFARLLEGKVPVKQCELLIEAVQCASRAAAPGEVVLLSPACASFDQFRDYEARGDAFRAAVEALA